MTPYEVLSAAVPVVIAAGLFILVVQALSTGRDRATAVKTGIGCSLMAIVALVVILGASGGSGGGPDGPDDPDVPVTDYTLSGGFLTLNGDVPAYSGNAPWRNSDVGLIVVSDDVHSIGSGAFADLDSDVLFEGTPRMAGSAFSHPFASDPVEGGYYMVSAGYYVLVPEVPEDMYTYTVSSGAATLTGISDSWERPECFVMKVPTENYNRYPVTKFNGMSGEGVSPFRGVRAVFSDSIESSGNYAFNNCTTLKCVSLSAIASTAQNMFKYCSSLEALSIPAAATIGNYCFHYCSSLSSVSLPAATAVNQYAFQYCSSLSSVSLPAATAVNNYAFSNCLSLESVSLPAAASIGGYSFNGCTSLKDVSMPLATSIGEYAFTSCVSLESVYMPSVSTINQIAFQSCASIAVFDLSSAVTINGNAFRYAWGVQEARFGDGLTTVATSSFVSWTFYDSTGTTTISKTAEALAGKHFMGTYAALIEVPEGEQSLSPEMLRKVADLTEAAEEARKSLASPDDDEHLPGGDPEEEP